jgi:capsular exopolysaccharide synthesis family protein
MQAITKSSTSTPATSIGRNLFEDLFRIGGVVRRRWRLIAVVNLVFLTLAILYLAETKTVYKATARLLVIQQGERPINVGGPSPFGHLPSQQDTLSTHVLVIRSPVIVGRALDLAQLNQLSIESVINSLKVQQATGGGKILDLEYQTASEDEAKKLMAGTIAAYEQFLKDNFQKDTRDVITLIGKARDELSKELRELERTYLEFHKQNPALTGSSDGRSFLSRRLEQWDQAAGMAVARSLQIKTQLELARRLSREGVGTSVISAALNQLGGGVGTIAPDAELPRVDFQYGNLSKADGRYEQIAEQLADVEYRRHSVERLIAHFRSQQAALAQESPPDGKEILDAFYSDPVVARRLEDLEEARLRHTSVSRVARNSTDPAVQHNRGTIKRLESEISQLWHEKKSAIQTKLRARDEDDAIHQSEIDLVMLRAREAFLRERVEEARVEQIDSLKDQRSRLIRDHDESDPQVAAVDQQVVALQSGRRDDIPRKGRGQTDLMIESLERSLEGVETMRAEIQKRLDADVSSTHETEITLLLESNLRSNLERQRTLFDSVAAQLKQAQLVSDYGSVTAQTISPPKVKPIRPWAVAVCILALLVGTGCGTGVALLVELFEARVRTFSELRSMVNLPVITLVPNIVLGQVPGLTKCGLLCHEAPRSLAAELYKSARTQLEIWRRDRRAQVLLITSPNCGDGKSTTSSNLAICQAHAGRKMLLIDGDLRRPSIHSIFSLVREQGLSQILNKELTAEQAIQPTEIANLDVLTCGRDTSNPAELLSSPSLSEFLDEMRAKYDGIIIDAPPLLIVTDPWIISAVVDGLILVVKVGEVRRQALEQTMEILKTLVTPALGVVINGITRDQFGFDNRFNNLYGYGYGNGYGYHQDPKSPPPGVPGRTGGALEMVAGTNCNGKSTHRDIGLDPDSSA